MLFLILTAHQIALKVSYYSTEDDKVLKINGRPSLTQTIIALAAAALQGGGVNNPCKFQS